MPQRPGALRGATSAKPKPEGQGLFIASIFGVIALGIGLIYGAIIFVSSMQSKAENSVIEVSPEVKARDAARLAQAAKEKQEELASVAKAQAATEAYLAAEICDGNTKVAKELMSELKSIEKELDALYTDADSNNDPKDLRAFWNKSLQSHAEKNGVIHHWLGGKPASVIAAALWGEDGSGQRQRGKVADFLLGGGYASTGTGFFVSEEGWILTNQHVVDDATEVDIRDADGVIRKAKVVKVDAQADIALLKVVDRPKHWLHLAKVEVPMGSDVCTIGYPNADVQGVEPKYTTGTVSSLSGIRDDRDAYQITVPLQPGNSGGPLVEMKTGMVVGMVASVLRHDLGAENVSYAIKAGVIQQLLTNIPEAANAVAQPASETRGADTVTLAANIKASIVMVLVK